MIFDEKTWPQAIHELGWNKFWWMNLSTLIKWIQFMKYIQKQSHVFLWMWIDSIGWILPKKINKWLNEISCYLKMESIACMEYYL
jgi:hypothetical protein